MKAVFDSIAKEYDAQFSHSLIGQAQRNAVWGYLANKLKAKTQLKILEISCGTGEDALFFARQGHEVLATDASPLMLQATKDKISQYQLEAQVSHLQYDINNLDVEFSEASFDIVFSNFGGINCLNRENLPHLIAQCSRWLKPGGHLIWVIMGKFCWWETLYFLIKGQTRQSFRRATNQAVEASIGVEGQTLPIWYYTPYQIEKEASHYFQKQHLQAIGGFVPPSYLEKFFSHKQGWLKRLEWLDNATKKLPFLAYQSDHFLIDFKKSIK